MWRRRCLDDYKHTFCHRRSGCSVSALELSAACEPSRSDPGMEAACAVQQPPSVPGARDWLDEEKQSKAPQEAAEDGGGHHHEWRHHDKTEDN